MSIFYIRKTIGKNGKIFDCYKFRSMKKGANEGLEEALKKGLDKYGKPINDERITNLGKFLRKYWIDEIPQLVYNVPKGDMKIVGIRPREEREWEEYPIEVKEKALQQKPGLFAIQYGFKDLKDFNENIKVSKQYLSEYETSPFSTDLKYFFKVISKIVFHRVRSN
ncbi:sugar transferase [Candidatus Pacearchaeota archaeon]|nr:sugar transferase [Candidatus Pacearchaeota archaeon]